jgi:tRNA nucleotidyltransferase (CCA-adding enzyme)
MHDEPDYEPGSAEYNFFYGNGQLHVSPHHDHDALRGHAQVQDDHTGPMAVGHVSVNRGSATWAVDSNVSLRGLHRVLKEYTKQVGWKWGGLTSLDGEPVDDDFAPKKSMSLRDNETGTYLSWIQQGKTAHVPRDYPEVAREFLLRQGYKVADYPGGGNMTDQMTNYSPAGETYEQYSLGENKQELERPDLDKDDAPTGTFKCPNCRQIFPNWQRYMEHRQDELGPQDELPAEDGKFPRLDLDKVLPPHYHERRPFILPLASYKEAARVEDFDLYASLWGYDTDQGHQHYGAYIDGEPVGYASVRLHDTGPAEVVMVRSLRRGVGSHLVAALQVHYPELITHTASPQGERLAKRMGMTQQDDGLWKWSAGSNPKDMINQSIPFIYDINEDRLAIGQPGQRQSDIPGEFTPGGIVEGEYEPGGKVIIHTMTNVPYSTRHLLDLWYWSLPHMQVTGLEMHDDEGGRTKLAHDEEYCPACGATDEYQGGLCYSCGHGSHPCPRCGFEMDHQGLLGGDEPYCPSCGYEGGRYVVPELSEMQARPPGYDGPPAATYPWTMQPEQATKMVRGLPRIQGAKVSKTDVGTYIKTLSATDPAVWNAYQALRNAGGQVYVVGGAVRDALLQKEPKDIDLMVTGVPSEQVNHVLENLPGRVDLTGKSFGVYRYNVKGHEVEIALPRTERSTGDRRVDFDVTVDHDLPVEDDLLRRDFTVNSMAVDLDSGRLVDPYGGARDIDERKLRTTHPASFREDPTRLIRALVMHGRYGFNPDESTRQQMVENAIRLPLESADAKQAIIEKLMKSSHPAAGVRLAHETGLLKHIFPEVETHWDFDQNNPHHNYTLGEHLLNVLDGVSELSDDPDLRMAALLHDIGKPASAWKNPDTGFNHYYRGPEGQGADHEAVGAEMAQMRLDGLRWPKARSKRITHLIQHHMFPAFSSAKGARKFLHRVGDEHANDLLTLRYADQRGKGQAPEEVAARTHVDTQRGLVEQVRSAQEPTSQSALSINGNDLISLGLKPGPALGEVLRQLTDDVIEDPALNDRDSLMQRAKEYIDARPV